jgi:hypothetical protein
MNILNQKLKKDTAVAADLCEKWMLKHIYDENIYTGNIADPISYYKWPLTLIARDKKGEAVKLLRWINEHCLTANGDYLSDRSGFHKEFHTYSTLWIVLAAIKLEDAGLVEKLLNFILKYHNSETGGLATFPAKPEMITEDMVSTAFLGMVACELKDKNLADKILQYFETMNSLQTGDEKFWLRINQNGSLIKSFGLNDDSKTYSINIGKEEECYYFLGAACFFIARYIETFDDKPLYLARLFASVLEKAGSKALSTIWAAKVAPGCTALYSITSDKYFFDLADPVIRAVLKGQTDAGYWIKNGKPWTTVSAEQCFWLTDISDRL